MKFGGGTKFGSGKFGGDPLGLHVGHVCERMLRVLSQFTRDGTTGFLKTLTRLSGPLDDRATWGQIMQYGAPAMLVHYGGTDFDKIYGTVSGNLQEGESIFSVVCIANDFQSRQRRLEGQGRTRYEPGLDNMTQWAAYYVTNELARTKSVVQRPRLTDIRYVAYEDLHFVSIINWRATTFWHHYDAAPTDRLRQLGICHNPLNNLKLFEDDNDTPNTDDPTSPAVGWTELAP